MKKLNNLLNDLSYKHSRESVVAVGNFDGVHLGHQKILNTTKEIASSINGDCGAFTFAPHPVLVVRPEKGMKLIVSDYQDRVKMIEKMGLDFSVLEYFSESFRTLSPKDFILFLQKKLNMIHLVVGDDYSFGKNREGNIEALEIMSREMGFKITVVPEVGPDGRRVTSSYIRKMLKKGALRTVNRYMLNNFFIKGYVESGFRRGHVMGYPTANLKLYSDFQLLPKGGVYATLTQIGSTLYPSMTNIGYNPTFQNREQTIETHILNFNKMIYYEKIKIHFMERMRDEIKFKGIEALIKQLRTDKNDVIQYFENHPITENSRIL